MAADDGSPFFSDDDDININSKSRSFDIRLVATCVNSSAPSHPFNIQLVAADDKLRHVMDNANPISECLTSSGLATRNVMGVLAAESNAAEVTCCGETASILAGMNLFIYLLLFACHCVCVCVSVSLSGKCTMAKRLN